MPELIDTAASAHPGAPNWVVACLCAQWCITCRDYCTAFDTVARAAPAGTAFVWIDIEDDSDWMGDVEVENFPTLLIARNAAVPEVHFFGPMLPHAQQLTRLLASTQANNTPLRGVDAPVQELALRLQAVAAPR
ncbi:thioredoxin domain-containing protein [Variovorax terrae]|uniref:Thioredoxin domain-containing protein n=1 Tax=Variovorax terrae TaxID=2923278 RepID=A0A9X1VZG2_9BURK|nr:thioredoxin domain-containing protein [Variovorax terrae]MCJ0763298.1 thioredoxin domain-containing protein [Variovorax terrae]